MSNRNTTNASAEATKTATSAAAPVYIRVRFVKTCTLSKFGVTATRGAEMMVTPDFCKTLEDGGYAVRLGF